MAMRGVVGRIFGLRAREVGMSAVEVETRRDAMGSSEW